MPDNSANRATIRAAGHSLRCYASFIVPAVIVSGTVSATPTFPGNNNVVNVTYVVGAFGDVAYGMEVAFFKPVTFAFIGRTHIRYGAAPADSLNIFVREFAQATLNLTAGDIFRIYPEYRLHDKLVAATTAFPPDFRFVTTENATPEPVVNSGGDWAGFVDNYGTATEAAYATVQMTGSTSFTVYPTGGTVNHLWTLPTGVTFAPGSASTDANPVLRATVGTHTITHRGADAASGITRLSHPSIRVHDASDLPHRVTVTTYEGAAESGWNWEVDVLSGALTLAAVPDGCKVVLWAQERYAGTAQSFRNASPGRKHILGMGYAARDTSSGSGEDGAHRLSFEVISPLERLKQIKSYSKVMLEDASPNQWSEIYILGVLRGILQILQYYTMWCESGLDTVVDAAFLDERYPAHFLDASDFYTQMMELAKAVDARMVVDRTGRLDIHTHPAYIPLGSRAAVTVALELEDADILDYEWTREHFPKVAQMKVSGVSGGATGNVAVFSLYPGGAAGEALDAPEIARLILDATTPQTDVNDRAGRYGALADMVLYSATGIRTKAFDLRLKLRGAWDVFDFYKEYVEVVITGNRRGLDLTGLRFYLLSSSTGFDPDYGTTTTDLVLRMETNAAAGETFIPDEEATPPYTPPDDTPPPYTPPLPTPWLPAGLNRLGAVNEDGYWYYTYNLLDAVSATWARTLIPNLSGTLTDSVQDAFTPTRQIVVTTAAAGIYTVENVTGNGAGMVTTLRKTLRAAVTDPLGTRQVEASFGADYIVVSTYYGGSDGTWICYSLDGGLTWSAEAQISAFNSTTASQEGLFVSSRAPGTGVVGVYTANGAGTAALGELYNLSAAFASSAASGIATTAVGAGCVTKAWADSEQTLYYGADNGSTLLYRKIGAAAAVDVTPTSGGQRMRPGFHRALHVCPIDVDTVLLAGVGTTLQALFSSIDGGTTWVPLTANFYMGVEVAGDSAAFGYAYGDGVIATVNIATDTVTDRSGNIPASFPAAGRFVRIRGL